MERVFGESEGDASRQRTAMSIKVSYLKQLKASVNLIAANSTARNGQYLDDSSQGVPQLLYLLEQCLFHGLSPEGDKLVHFWDLLESLKRTDTVSFGSSIDMLIMSPSPCTPYGRCRGMQPI